VACHGHAASVESVALNGAGDRVASGDWTGGLKLWRASLEGADTAAATATSSSKRARKASPTQVLPKRVAAASPARPLLALTPRPARFAPPPLPR